MSSEFQKNQPPVLWLLNSLNFSCCDFHWPKITAFHEHMQESHMYIVLVVLDVVRISEESATSIVIIETTMMTHWIGDFWVAFRLCFKASPSANPFIWKLVLFTCKWILLIFLRFELAPNFIFQCYRPQTWQFYLFFPVLSISSIHKVPSIKFKY